MKEIWCQSRQYLITFRQLNDILILITFSGTQRSPCAEPRTCKKRFTSLPATVDPQITEKVAPESRRGLFKSWATGGIGESLQRQEIMKIAT